MSATPGQRAYEGFVAFQGGEFQFETWQEKDETGDRDVMGRADWEAAGQAVLNDAFPGLRKQLATVAHERDRLRDAMDGLTTEMHAEADRIAPPGNEPDPEDIARAQVLHESAARIRQILGPEAP